MGGWYCNKQPPPPLPTDLKCLYFISFYVKLQEKQVLDFPPQVLYKIIRSLRATGTR